MENFPAVNSLLHFGHLNGDFTISTSKRVLAAVELHYWLEVFYLLSRQNIQVKIAATKNKIKIIGAPIIRTPRSLNNWHEGPNPMRQAGAKLDMPSTITVDAKKIIQNT